MLVWPGLAWGLQPAVCASCNMQGQQHRRAGRGFACRAVQAGCMPRYALHPTCMVTFHSPLPTRAAAALGPFQHLATHERPHGPSHTHPIAVPDLRRHHPPPLPPHPPLPLRGWPSTRRSASLSPTSPPPSPATTPLVVPLAPALPCHLWVHLDHVLVADRVLAQEVKLDLVVVQHVQVLDLEGRVAAAGGGASGAVVAGVAGWRGTASSPAAQQDTSACSSQTSLPLLQSSS